MLNTSYFTHLNKVEQTYYDHFRDSIGYSWRAFKSSLCFFVHAIWPDVFVTSGSDTIMKLHETIRDKYDAMQLRQQNNDFTLVETIIYP